MDNLTHSLVGALLGRSGLNRLTPLAAPLLIVAANAPDLDMVGLVGGALANVRVHRGWTHSLLFMPVMAAWPVAVVALVGRRRLPWLRAWLVSSIAVLSHLLLDWTNTYGIRLLTPLSERWFALDIAHVFDFAIWTVLLLAFASPALSKLVSGEIGARPTRGRGAAIAALTAVLAVYVGRWWLHGQAVVLLEARPRAGLTPRRVLALPDPLNPWAWTGLTETDEAWVRQELNLLRRYDPDEGQVLRKPAPGPSVDAANATPTMREFLRFARAPFWEVVPRDASDGGDIVQVVDLRFGTPREPRFFVTVEVDASGRAKTERFRIVDTR